MKIVTYRCDQCQNLMEAPELYIKEHLRADGTKTLEIVTNGQLPGGEKEMCSRACAKDFVREWINAL